MARCSDTDEASITMPARSAGMRGRSNTEKARVPGGEAQTRPRRPRPRVWVSATRTVPSGTLPVLSIRASWVEATVS